jgi:hypothetical protein
MLYCGLKRKLSVARHSGEIDGVFGYFYSFDAKWIIHGGI